MAQCQGWKLPSFLSVRGAPRLLGAMWTQRKNVHVCLTLQIALLGAPTRSALVLVETGHDHSGFCDEEDRGEISPAAHTFVVTPSPAWAPGQSPATCEAPGHGASLLVNLPDFLVNSFFSPSRLYKYIPLTAMLCLCST